MRIALPIQLADFGGNSMFVDVHVESLFFCGADQDRSG